MKDGPATEVAVADPTETEHIRLHISPFDADLLKAVLPPAVLPNARNISFHSLQAFPDKRFGFVDLPLADAEKIKKRLNGAVLKGAKVRIETARPDDMPTPAGSAALADPAENASKKERKSKRKEDKSKKRKRDAKEVEGVELEEGRKVKRGWTVPADTLAKKEKERSKDKKKDKKEKKSRKKEAKSAYTDGPECLVKTVLLPNVAANLDETTVKNQKKGKKARSREIVVHEFEHNSKFPTFLKNSEPPKSNVDLEFVDGKGWVNTEGTVVEPMTSSRMAWQSKSADPIPQRKSKATTPPVEDEDETSSSGSSSEDDSVDQEAATPAPKNPSNKKDLRINPGKGKAKQAIDECNENVDSPRPKSASSVRSLTIKIPPPPTTPAAKVHPLEALYKRSKQDGDAPAPAASTSEPFSFFGAGDEAEDNDDEDEGASHRLAGNQPPLTPFTQQEFEWRNLRSAAPTPDTAHINKTFKFWPRDGAEDDIEEEEEDEKEEGEDPDEQHDSGQTPSERNEDGDQPDAAPAGPTDFQEWFWQNRGDLNRSWRKRRKTAAKEKRYRENRARADRAI